MNDIRFEEEKFSKEIMEVVSSYFNLLPVDVLNVKKSTHEEDTKESFDLVFNSRVEISVRIRNNYALQWKDFTIRSRAEGGGKTELDKINDGFGSVYLYAWKTEDSSSFAEWMLIDINKIRDHLNELGSEKDNYDGTKFRPMSINTLRNYNAIIRSSFE